MCDKCKTMGRPKKLPQDKASSVLNVKMTAEQKRDLARLAKRSRVPMAALVKMLIEREVDNA